MTGRGGLSRSLAIVTLALAVSLVVFETTSLDLVVQDYFFDEGTRRWLIDGHEPIGRLLFYDGPKAALIILAVALIGVLVGRRSWRARLGTSRREIAMALLIMCLVPATISLLKNTTGVFCPRELRRYGGPMPYVTVFQRYPPDDQPRSRGCCYPAGHPSGGFALFGLAFLRRSRRFRAAVVALGVLAGSVMGVYQMAKGAHFLSHVVVTGLVAGVLAIGLGRLMAQAPDAPGRT